MRHFRYGSNNRAVASHKLNYASSRSAAQPCKKSGKTFKNASGKPAVCGESSLCCRVLRCTASHAAKCALAHLRPLCRYQ